MHIHLKRGEKIYINGAVLKIDRRASIEFLNDVDFLLENHVMQADEARTPLRQLYFVVQTMLIDPVNAGVTNELYKHLSHRVAQALESPQLREVVRATDECVGNGRYFDALKQLRSGFAQEEQLLSEGAQRPVEAA